MRRRRAASGAALALAVGLVAGAGAAQAQAYGTAATVNGRPIPQQRLERFVERYAAERGRNVANIRSPTAYRDLLREALDVLVDDELLFQEAERLGKVAAPAEVAAAVAEARAQLTQPGAFEARLAQDGLDAAGFEAQVRRQLSVRRLVVEVLAVGLAVGDAEVHQAYASNPDRFTTPSGVLPEAEVRERIRAQLLAARQREAVHARLEALRANAVIRIAPSLGGGSRP